MRLILALATLLVALPVEAATYTYTIDFGPYYAHVDGTIVTYCDNCVIANPTLVSWTFTGSNDSGLPPQTISSTDAGAQFDIFHLPAGLVYPLTVTPTAAYWNYDYHYADGTPYYVRYDGSDPSICFCIVTGQWDPITRGLSFGNDPFHTEYQFWYNLGDMGEVGLMDFNMWSSGNMILGNLTSSTAPIVTPLPSALWLFASGLVGLLMVRKRSR